MAGRRDPDGWKGKRVVGFGGWAGGDWLDLYGAPAWLLRRPDGILVATGEKAVSTGGWRHSGGLVWSGRAAVPVLADF